MMYDEMWWNMLSQGCQSSVIFNAGFFSFFFPFSSHVGELHRIHRAADQVRPAEVHAVQNPGEELSQSHDLGASV